MSYSLFVFNELGETVRFADTVGIVDTRGVTRGAWTAYPSGGSEFNPGRLGFLWDSCCSIFRDRPFNLKGGLWFFVSFKKNFRTTQELEYLFSLSPKAPIFFQNLTLGYMTKTLNQIKFFFLHQNQNIFFSIIGNQNIFLEKKP